jgi:hypothetical protein
MGKIIWTSGLGNIGNRMIQKSSDAIYTLYTWNMLDSLTLNKIDSSGNLLWRKSYFNVTRGNSLCFSKDGNILLAGFKDTLKQFDIVTAKVDLNGKLLFRKRINVFSGNLFMYPQSVKATTDYGYIFTGPTDYPNPSLRDNLFLLKTDSLCNAPSFTGIITTSTEISFSFKLLPNYPNPFNGSTLIKYEIIKPGNMSISVYDVNGKEITQIKRYHQNSGNYELRLNTDDYFLSTGIYFIKLNFDNEFKIAKIVLLK